MVQFSATDADMRQKLNKSCSNGLSQVASQASRRTGYDSAKRTKLMSNHNYSGENTTIILVDKVSQGACLPG
jgi:hypothetical protein